jgi:hypothetical protein
MRDTFDFMQDGKRARQRFGDNESANADARADLVDLELVLRADKPLSIGVTHPERGADTPWIFLPKSQIEYERRGARVKVTLPRWLAEKKGLA